MPTAADLGRWLGMGYTLPMHLLAASILVIAGSVTGPLTEAEFEELHSSLQPTGEETWRTIPWETSVLQAQARAGAEQKPLFIWAMDGHPLGCT